MKLERKSRFAEALEGLLDDTELFTRAEWSAVLGVSQAAISQWVNDKTIPRADLLSMIMLTLEHSSKIPSQALDAFAAMSSEPAINVSPHGKRMLPTVSAYMSRPASSELSSKLSKLSDYEQESVLEDVYSPSKNFTVVKKEPVSRLSNWCSGLVEDWHCTPHSMPVLVGSCGTGKSFIDSEFVDRMTSGMQVTPEFRVHPNNNLDEVAGPRLRWQEISTQANHIMVFGEPGSGKTSFVLNIFRALSERDDSEPHQWRGRIPVYVPLHRLSNVRSVNELWESCSISDPKVRHGELLLLFDGLDEVPTHRRQPLAQAIVDLRVQCPNAAFIITSRRSLEVESLRQIPWFSLQTPSDSRLLALVYNHASNTLSKSERYWDEELLQIGSIVRERSRFFHAIRTPLLHSYAAHLLTRSPSRGMHDADLLESCLSLLLSAWDKEKGVERTWSKWADVTLREFRHSFGRLCYRALLNQNPYFSNNDLLHWFNDVSGVSLGNADLQAVAESTGIIQPSKNNCWRFTHEYFQEYLAASFIVESGRDARDFLRPASGKPWAANVLRFACLIANDASPLLQFVLDSNEMELSTRMVTLAELMAQKFKASAETIDAICNAIVSWLEGYFTNWKIVTVNEQFEVFPSPLWRFAACQVGDDDTYAKNAREGKHILQTIKCIHQARGSVVKQNIRNRLANSANPVVRTLGESLAVEGFMESRLFSEGERNLFAAEVSEI